MGAWQWVSCRLKAEEEMLKDICKHQAPKNKTRVCMSRFVGQLPPKKIHFLTEILVQVSCSSYCNSVQSSNVIQKMWNTWNFLRWTKLCGPAKLKTILIVKIILVVDY